jgi:uncharacterized protein YfbU (UPF0304 family)
MLGVRSGESQSGGRRIVTNGIGDEMFKRMVLANQYRILALLDEADNVEFWERAADVAESGWPAADLPGFERLTAAARDPLTGKDQTFVLDVFTIYQLLQDAGDEGMTAEDGQGVEFPGFDGNHEPRLMSYALHLQREDRFTCVRSASPDYNSHWPMAETYRNMVGAWHRQGRPTRLSRRQFDEIVAERSRPIDLAAAIGR